MAEVEHGGGVGRHFGNSTDTNTAVTAGARTTKKNLQTIMNDTNASRAEGYKLDIDLVANNPTKVEKNMDVLYEKYIDKNDYSDKIEGLSSALQGELKSYFNEQEIINKIVENSNSKAFETGTEAAVTQADVQKAFDDQEDININVLKTRNDAKDDLTIFGKFNGNLMVLKFITKLKIMADVADQINKENIKVSGPTTVKINEDYSQNDNWCDLIDDKYRDEISIVVKYVDDQENGQTKKEVYKTTTRYIQLAIRKYYNNYENNAFNGGYSHSVYEAQNIKKYEKLFEDVGLKDRITYLKDSAVVD